MLYHDRALCVGERRGVEAELRRVVEGEPGELHRRQGEGVGDGVAGDGDADGVDEGDAGDPVAAQGRQFGGDPAADGVADDGDVPQAEGVEEFGVDPGQGGDVGEPVRAGGAVEAGVDGGEHPGGALCGEQAG